jgi:ABC-type methionine transport system permease subunit
VAGGLAFFFISIGTTVGVLLFHTGDKIRDAVMKSIEQAAARNPGPETQAVVDSLRSPEGFATMLAAGLLLTLIFYLVLSILGGVIGAGVGRRRPT